MKGELYLQKERIKKMKTKKREKFVGIPYYKIISKFLFQSSLLPNFFHIILNYYLHYFEINLNSF